MFGLQTSKRSRYDFHVDMIYTCGPQQLFCNNKRTVTYKIVNFTGVKAQHKAFGRMRVKAIQYDDINFRF